MKHWLIFIQMYLLYTIVVWVFQSVSLVLWIIFLATSDWLVLLTTENGQALANIYSDVLTVHFSCLGVSVCFLGPLNFIYSNQIGINRSKDWMYHSKIYKFKICLFINSNRLFKFLLHIYMKIEICTVMFKYSSYYIKFNFFLLQND